MKTTVYRVECNHGSKYFANGIEAYAYFVYMCETQNSAVEMWLIIKERGPKLYAVTQELVAYRGV